MKNVEELRTALSEVFSKLRTGEIKVKDAAEMSNIAGKMIQSAKVQCEYYTMRKETPRIPFLAGSLPPDA